MIYLIKIIRYISASISYQISPDKRVLRARSRGKVGKEAKTGEGGGGPRGGAGQCRKKGRIYFCLDTP